MMYKIGCYKGHSQGGNFDVFELGEIVDVRSCSKCGRIQFSNGVLFGVTAKERWIDLPYIKKQAYHFNKKKIDNVKAFR